MKIETKRLESKIIKQLKEDRCYDDEYLEHHVRSAIRKVLRRSVRLRK